MATHLLFESATGLSLFTSEFAEEIGKSAKSVQDSIDDLSKFGKMVKLVSFVPFTDAAHALEVANDVSEGVVHEFLQGLLELNLGKKAGVVLGVEERGLASSIKGTLGIECDASDRTLEVLRGIRLHQEKLLAGLESGDTKRSQLGLGHAYSRAKVKFNVNRSDNMIIQAIALLDQLDKDVNTFAMRVREWYGWHFPELVKIVPDNYQYAKVCHLIGDKAQITDETVEPLTELLDNNETLARNIVDAARASMGTDISEVDHLNIKNFATRVIHLYDYRKSLQTYLSEKMSVVAPNLAALIGDTVGARLISHAGSLTNLSKYPASTVQILGAEKALFRALKTKGNTPKYGLIYHSTFIGRAQAKNKGRISRFLANKASIASRVDCFSDFPSTKIGEALRDQVEERLAFYDTGSNPTKNADVMKKALEAAKAEAAEHGGADAMDVDEAPAKEEKKEKKKKRKSEAAGEETAAAEEGSPKKKKSKKSKDEGEKLSKEEKKALKKAKKEGKASKA
ncbi:hypothetical protein NBRC10512_003166 [Rhodotorula toruloides]|uniref:Nucleolar protein 56 n=2 Tax=Rhodotorula toruloides TaxID=5286 RepID=A0A061ATF1_RHOTO|nr:nucleolar protein 56 [Rhodotorula toruloides NP11]EMS23759.1 nucleolar protein 56 [Rhodotorula toruloides NP11]CDR40919.1 RHTO0S05e08856g1_1 [Rhodotorula toruloides]